MKCQFCGCLESKVVDSRVNENGTVIRRRRECISCGKRFTTYETIEDSPILVIKNSGTREAFDPNKIKNGVIKACEKRPVSLKTIDDLVNSIRKQLANSMVQEISSKAIGEMVMERLKTLDEVSYVRFASVYRQFKDINSFIDELNKLYNDKK